MAMMTPDRAKKLNAVKPADLRIARKETDDALAAYDGSKPIVVTYLNSDRKTVEAIANLYMEHWSVVMDKGTAPCSLTFSEKCEKDPTVGQNRGSGQK